jgi:predicted nucleic acid-binding protein
LSRPRLLLDTSALIALARLGLLDDVARRIGRIRAAPEVIDEATVAGRPGAEAMRQAIRKRRTVVLEPNEGAAIPGLGAGESATIRRAAADGMTAVIDDLDARRAGSRQEIALTGTIALLVRLAQLGGPPIAETLDELERIGFRVSAELRTLALEQRGGKPRR